MLNEHYVPLCHGCKCMGNDLLEVTIVVRLPGWISRCHFFFLYSFFLSMNWPPTNLRRNLLLVRAPILKPKRQLQNFFKDLFRVTNKCLPYRLNLWAIERRMCSVVNYLWPLTSILKSDDECVWRHVLLSPPLQPFLNSTIRLRKRNVRRIFYY